MESNVIRAFGKESWNRLKLLTEAVSQAGNTAKTEMMMDWQKMYRKIVPALLTPRSLLVQYASLSNVPSMIPAKHLAKAFINPANHTPSAVRNLTEESPDMWRRLNKIMGTIMFSGNLELDKTSTLLKPFSHFDGVTMVVIHEAAKSWAKESGRSKDWAMKKAAETIRLTQNTGTVPDATGTQLAMKQGDFLAMLGGTYGSQRAKTYNNFQRILRDKSKTKLQKAKEIAIAIVGSTLMGIVADQVFSRLRGKETSALGAIANEIVDTFTVGPHARALGISFYNLSSWMKGRKISGSAPFVINQAEEAINELRKFIKALSDDSLSAWKIVSQMVRTAAQGSRLAGIPASFITWTLDAIDAHVVDEEENADIGKSNKSKSRIKPRSYLRPGSRKPIKR
jgi:hypothetical protein